jgi:hypothetical protein
MGGRREERRRAAIGRPFVTQPLRPASYVVSNSSMSTGRFDGRSGKPERPEPGTASGA